MKKHLSEKKLEFIAIILVVAMVVGLGSYTAHAFVASSSPSVGTMTTTDRNGNQKTMAITGNPSFAPRKVIMVQQVIGVPFGHQVTIQELSWEQELVLEQLGTEVSIGDSDGKEVVLLEGDGKSFKKVIVPEEEEEPFYVFGHTWILGGPARGIARPVSTPYPEPPPAS